MPRSFPALTRHGAFASLLWAALPNLPCAPGPAPATDPPADPATCIAVAAAHDDDKIIAVCGALIENDKTLKADRTRALIARGGAYDRKEMVDRAIGDYDTVLRLDSSLADIFNARADLWRKKGDRPHAFPAFSAALKPHPPHNAPPPN